MDLLLLKADIARIIEENKVDVELMTHDIKINNNDIDKNFVDEKYIHDDLILIENSTDTNDINNHHENKPFMELVEIDYTNTDSELSEDIDKFLINEELKEKCYDNLKITLLVNHNGLHNVLKITEVENSAKKYNNLLYKVNLNCELYQMFDSETTVMFHFDKYILIFVFSEIFMRDTNSIFKDIKNIFAVTKRKTTDQNNKYNIIDMENYRLPINMDTINIQEDSLEFEINIIKFDYIIDDIENKLGDTSIQKVFSISELDSFSNDDHNEYYEYYIKKYIDNNSISEQ